ncbi:MAG: DUF1109 domain-containing protein [Gallionellaceae bacterium]|nr:DUF1109 domain-containing protein [Gallionellaceae bacterium]
MLDTEKLIASMARDASPVTPAPHPFMLGAKWLAAAIIYIALVLVFMGLRPDIVFKLRSPIFIAELVLLASIIISTALSAALLSFPDLHQKRWVVYTPIVAVVFFILLIFLSWWADFPPVPLPRHNVQCLLSIACLTLLPTAWMFYTMRGLASTHPYWTGSIALLSAFSIGALSLRLSEQTNSLIHVIQWHYLPMLAVGLIGLLLGKILLRW